MWRLIAWVACITAVAVTVDAHAMSDIQGFMMPAWLTGTWTSANGATASEETWSAPLGNSMIGMWRAVESGNAKVFELAAITVDEDGGAKLQLHHFDADGTAWEDKAKPTVLGFTKQTRDSVMFEGPEGDDYVRLTYAKAGTSELTVTLEKNPTSPSMSTSTYRFRKKR